ncbi:BON domain-containing protein [Sphingopyxis macrogoltabida]|uniref:BON domain-containing protein n=1 Tax=Sphingopyxis macrogoltabida TaxID=33050 RepID=UPI0006CA6A91|nr:BON domain-containing protein [Sphingopyxis macrogoltabida]
MERQDYKGRSGNEDKDDRDTRSEPLHDWNANREEGGHAYGGYPEAGFGPRDVRRYGGFDPTRGGGRYRGGQARRYGADSDRREHEHWDREQGGYAGYGFGERYDSDSDYRGRGRASRRDWRDDYDRVPLWLAGSYADLYGWPTALPHAAADFGRSTYRRDVYPATARHHERGFLERAGDEVRSWFGDEEAQRRRDRDHRGRGPSDYIRSDDRIREDVNDQLTEDSWIDASRISVAVSDGEVTLGGQVDSKHAKRRAEDLADDVTGVKHVQNNLRVDTGYVPQGS